LPEIEVQNMKRSDFYYDLPEELIAQTPAEKRDMSRLMVLDKKTGEILHRRFCDITEFLRAGDCLVLNNTRVLPARLIGERPTGGAVEVVLLRDRGGDVWECLVRPGRKMKTGAAVLFGGGELRGTVTDEIEGGNRLIKFEYEGIFLEVLERLGRMPLPPYIHETLSDPERYQTVYSKEVGSAAAPTAGLHFTRELLDKIREMGVDVQFVTLHVGLGTFRPVKAENIEDHEMHAEYCIISEETASAVNRAKKEGRRIIAVGTTSCRTLESRCSDDGRLEPYAGFTNAFIYPGYKFKCIDGLITNFHLPESTLIMLVSALAGRENILNAYNEAIRERYRFFSFGDAMYIS
jgi:S-adenosylmethionine:tRNA ribosyltransferase-isomerase